MSRDSQDNPLILCCALSIHIKCQAGFVLTPMIAILSSSNLVERAGQEAKGQYGCGLCADESSTGGRSLPCLLQTGQDWRSQGIHLTCISLGAAQSQLSETTSVPCQILILCAAEDKSSAPLPAELSDGLQIGSIKLDKFVARSQPDVASAVLKLTDDGANEFVLDLRNNLGGLVEEGVEVARLFLDGKHMSYPSPPFHPSYTHLPKAVIIKDFRLLPSQKILCHAVMPAWLKSSM